MNDEQCGRVAHISLLGNLCETRETLGKHHLTLVTVILAVISHLDIMPSDRWDEKSMATF